MIQLEKQLLSNWSYNLKDLPETKTNLWLYIHLNLMVQKNLDSLYVGVPIAHKIGPKGETQSLTGLWTLARPCKISGLEKTGYLFVFKLFKNINNPVFHMY